MKRATAYKRGKIFVIHASSRTTNGVWILAEPCIWLPVDCPDQELGDVMQAALGGSDDGVPHPTQWGRLLEPLLKAAGVKSWKTFAKSASCVEVEQDVQGLVLIPTTNLGTDEGYQAIEPKTKMSLPASSDMIGAKLREVFSQCS